MLKELLFRFRKFLLWCLLISFVGTVTCAVLMQALPRGDAANFFREMHPLFGFALTILVILHLITRWRVFLPANDYQEGN